MHRSARAVNDGQSWWWTYDVDVPTEAQSSLWPQSRLHPLRRGCGSNCGRGHSPGGLPCHCRRHCGGEVLCEKRAPTTAAPLLTHAIWLLVCESGMHIQLAVHVHQAKRPGHQQPLPLMPLMLSSLVSASSLSCPFSLTPIPQYATATGRIQLWGRFPGFREQLWPCAWASAPEAASGAPADGDGGSMLGSRLAPALEISAPGNMILPWLPAHRHSLTLTLTPSVLHLSAR